VTVLTVDGGGCFSRSVFVFFHTFFHLHRELAITHVPLSRCYSQSIFYRHPGLFFGSCRKSKDRRIKNTLEIATVRGGVVAGRLVLHPLVFIGTDRCVHDAHEEPLHVKFGRKIAT